MKAYSLIFCIACAGVFFAAGPTQAQAQYDVYLDTSPIVGHPDEPFSIDFQFLDGSGTGDGNNTITLSDFQFDGGGPTDVPDEIGDAAGDLSSTVTLDDGQPFNEFTQQFEPGDAMSFHVSTTTNVDPGGVFDELDFSILDNTLQPLPTLDPAGGNVLLRMFIDGSSPSIETYATDPDAVPNAGGPAINMGPPIILPESSSLLFLGIGLPVLILGARRWKSVR